LPIEIKFGGVLDAQNHLVRGHAFGRVFNVGCQDVSPFNLNITEEAIGRDGVGPVGAGQRDAGGGIGA
jgi:hypothetical protein